MPRPQPTSETPKHGYRSYSHSLGWGAGQGRAFGQRRSCGEGLSAGRYATLSTPVGTNPNTANPKEESPKETNPKETNPKETNPKETNPAPRHLRWFLLFFLLSFLASARPATAQDTFDESGNSVPWIISPYQIAVWFDFVDCPQLAQKWRPRLPGEVSQRLRAMYGATWQTEIRELPDSYHQLSDSWGDETLQTLSAAERWPSREIGAADTANTETANTGTTESGTGASQNIKYLEYDKIFVVAIRPSAAGFTIQVGEVDGRSRALSTPHERTIVRDDELAYAMTDLIREAFIPVGRIRRSTRKEAVVHLRAGQLTGDLNQPAESLQGHPVLPQPGQYFRIVLRRNDRYGKPAKNGIQELAVTLLEIERLEKGIAHCKIITGLREPLRPGGSRKIERLALIVDPVHSATTLQLRSDDPAAKPLIGYSVFSKQADNKFQPLGESDWQGNLNIPAEAGGRALTLYVRNGRRNLARVPLLPGVVAEQVVRLPNDDLRLSVEGFLRGVQEKVVVTTAMRQVAKARILAHIKAGEVEKARDLFRDLQKLADRDDLERSIRERQQQTKTEDRRAQARIDRMFKEARDMISKNLPNSFIDDVRVEISRAAGP